MASDRRIEEVLSAGRRNQETWTLARNWCAHIQLVKTGGTGLLEQSTGLPIGHHGLACEHAPEAGYAAWDLRDAALDFYDRNCNGCTKRQGVGLPNLSSLVTARDERRAAREAERNAAAAGEAEALAGRQAVRATLRATLTPPAAAILDDIERLDLNRSDDDRARLVEVARLAPEHFGADLVAYLFGLAEDEGWFLSTGLQMLAAINADPARVAALAVRRLARGAIDLVAAKLLLARTAHLDAELAAAALGAAIDWAAPRRDYGSPYPSAADDELLRALWSAFPERVGEQFRDWLASRSRYAVGLAARGLEALADHDPAVTCGFERDLVAKYLRARYLIDDFDEDDDRLQGLEAVIARAFERAPAEVDALIQEYATATDRAALARAFRLYKVILYGLGGSREKPVDPASPAHSLAFDRLLWGAAAETGKPDMQEAFLDTFRHDPLGLSPLVRAKADMMTGALFLLDDRLRQLDAAGVPRRDDPLAALTRSNERTAVVGLMGSIAHWLGAAAAGDPATASAIPTLLEQIPEDREAFRSAALKALVPLAETVDGLGLALPYLYGALVGASVRLRGDAARALGEFSYQAGQHVPPLVHEAFLALLTDPYVYVHKSAVRALRRGLRLSDDLKQQALWALVNLVTSYRPNRGEAEFLATCVETIVYLRSDRDNLPAGLADFLVACLLEADAAEIAPKIAGLSHVLDGAAGWPLLLARTLPLIEASDHDGGRAGKLLDQLSPARIAEHRETLAATGGAAPTQPGLVVALVEALSRGGAWADAADLAERALGAVGTSRRFEARRLFLEAIATAADLEATLARGDLKAVPAVRERWDQHVKKRKAQQRDAKNADPGDDLPFSLWSD